VSVGIRAYYHDLNVHVLVPVSVPVPVYVYVYVSVIYVISHANMPPLTVSALT